MNFLVTGGGSGLGLALCAYFAERDHNVLLTDCNAAAAEAGCTAIGHANCHWRELDVRSEVAVDALVRELETKRVDVLINNAGLQHVAPLDSFPADRWQELVDVMLCGSARLTRVLLPKMREQNFGRVILIGSIHSLVASPFKSAYVAAKHGLLGLARTVALETAALDVTINTICPSYIRTPLVEQQIADQARVHNLPEDEVVEQIMLRPMPKKAFISTDEIAGTIEFLISPAARNISGQAITIDGGWTAQ